MTTYVDPVWLEAENRELRARVAELEASNRVLAAARDETSNEHGKYRAAVFELRDQCEEWKKVASNLTVETTGALIAKQIEIADLRHYVGLLLGERRDRGLLGWLTAWLVMLTAQRRKK